MSPTLRIGDLPGTVRCDNATLGSFSLWRMGEKYYLRDRDEVWGDTWYGPLTDMERGAFYRLAKMKALDHEPQ